jgi:hypothetical protein
MSSKGTSSNSGLAATDGETKWRAARAQDPEGLAEAEYVRAAKDNTGGRST